MQVEWTSIRFGIRWSKSPSSIYKRFSIVKTEDGFTVTDHKEKETVRVKSFALAKAWAGIRVGETVVRHN